MNTNLQERIEAFASLGYYLNLFVQNDYQAIAVSSLNVSYEVEDFNLLQNTLADYITATGPRQNAWFTPFLLKTALQAWANALCLDSLETFTKAYTFSNKQHLKIGLIMAGNLPLVGYHDYLCVLLSGNRACIKLSSNDNILLPLLHQILNAFFPKMGPTATFTTDSLKDINAVIATGSNNSARYFEYYFGKYPHIIRHNRQSVAVITGNESTEELQALMLDMFLYFGRGCRSVSKIYVPRNYPMAAVLEYTEKLYWLKKHPKYMNNYNYNKAIFLVNKVPFLDNSFVLFTENSAFSSPIAVIHYAYYNSITEVETELQQYKNQLQCIVGKADKHIPFGKSQFPDLQDFADDIDTMAFLEKL